MHGLSTIIRMNMSKEERDEAARRAAAARPVTASEDKPGENPGEIDKPQTV
jgi:hypothetical protein